MTFAAPSFAHLRTLTDAGGLYEHADRAVPRPEHGYCVDDVARGLVVCSRDTGQDGPQLDLVEAYLTFVLAAQQADGTIVNRRSSDLSWQGGASTDDCWGRALWGLGAVVAGPSDEPTRRRALEGFDRSAALRSPWTRSMAFAGLGAAHVLAALPEHRVARLLLAEAATAIGSPAPDPRWPWPEPRLSYANAALAEVLIAAGDLLGRSPWLDDGLHLLTWLLAGETREGRLSLTPVGGRGPDGPSAGQDQQPIEAATLADACARAFAVTGEQRWADAVSLCASWFYGFNDAGVVLHEAATGGGFDGLEQLGRNDNQGAESTLAFISTLQQARRLSLQRA